MIIDVILEAKYIPHGSVVRKISGSSEYTLMDNVSIYSDDPDKRQNIKTDGCKFLVSSSGTIVCVSETKKFVLETTLEVLTCILKGEGDEEDQDS